MPHFGAVPGDQMQVHEGVVMRKDGFVFSREEA